MVKSGVPQVSLYVSVFFNIFIDYLDEEIECAFSKIASDVKLDWGIDLLRARKTL